MAHFMISYDLHNQRTYEPVWKKLGSWGAVRLLESMWLVTLNNTALEVRDALKAVIDADDSIAVIELEPSAMWGTWNAKKDGVDWLKKNIG